MIQDVQPDRKVQKESTLANNEDLGKNDRKSRNIKPFLPALTTSNAQLINRDMHSPHKEGGGSPQTAVHNILFGQPNKSVINMPASHYGETKPIKLKKRKSSLENSLALTLKNI